MMCRTVYAEKLLVNTTNNTSDYMMGVGKYFEVIPYRLSLLLFFLFATIFVYGQTPDLDWSWQSVFVDNFNTIDDNRWYVLDNNVPGNPDDNSEEEYIFLSSNVYLSISFLPFERWISVRLAKLSSPLPHPNGGSCLYNNQHFYTAGRVKSKIPYHYGFFEIKTLLPQGECNFPAFWLHNEQKTGSAPFYNEIDVMEFFGDMDNMITTNIHCSVVYPFDSLDRQYDVTPVNNVHNYHTYAVEWSKSRIIWFVDGEIVRVFANNHRGVGIQNPMYLYFTNSRYDLGSDEETAYPGIMKIKQISSYELKCDSLTIVNGILDFDTYNYALKKSISLGSETTFPVNGNISLRATDYIEWRPGFEIPFGTEVFFEVGHYK